MTDTSAWQHDFRHRLAAVLADLKAAGTGDGQAMYSLGSIASQICATTQARDWSHLKTILNEKDFRALITSFERQGKGYLASGDGHSAYAMQALSVSLVARTQPDQAIKAGDALLDELIDAAIKNYRQYGLDNTRLN